MRGQNLKSHVGLRAGNKMRNKSVPAHFLRILYRLPARAPLIAALSVGQGDSFRIGNKRWLAVYRHCSMQRRHCSMQRTDTAVCNVETLQYAT